MKFIKNTIEKIAIWLLRKCGSEESCQTCELCFNKSHINISMKTKIRRLEKANFILIRKESKLFSVINEMKEKEKVYLEIIEEAKKIKGLVQVR